MDEGCQKEPSAMLDGSGNLENIPELVHQHHPAEDREILGVRLLKRLASPFAALTRSSQTLLRLDLRRPVSFPKRPPSTRPPPPPSSSCLLSSVHGSRARLQLMQTWDFPPRCEDEAAGEPKRVGGLNLGIGGSVEMDDDGGIIVPKARVKTKYAILHVLPKPCLELRTKFPVGVSSLAASIRCRKSSLTLAPCTPSIAVIPCMKEYIIKEGFDPLPVNSMLTITQETLVYFVGYWNHDSKIPLTYLDNMWSSPTSQLMLNFYNEVGSGFHLTPGSLEFDEHLLKIGRYTTVRVSASVSFPRSLPPEDDEQPPFRLDVRSIGLKTRII